MLNSNNAPDSKHTRLVRLGCAHAPENHFWKTTFLSIDSPQSCFWTPNETNSRFKNERITVDSKNSKIKNKIEWIGLFEKKRKDAVKTCNIENI